MLSCQVGALHIPHHIPPHSPPWHERTLVSAHPTGSTHPRITALLTLFLLSPDPRGPHPVADTAQLLFPSLAVAGLAATASCQSGFPALPEPAGCRGGGVVTRLSENPGRPKADTSARFQAGWVQSRGRGGRGAPSCPLLPSARPSGACASPYSIRPNPGPRPGIPAPDLCNSVSAGQAGRGSPELESDGSPPHIPSRLKNG